MVGGADGDEATDWVVGSTVPVDVVEVPVEEAGLLVVDDAVELLELEDVEVVVLDLCSELLVEVVVSSCVLEM